ncbi:iron chaperone [Adhaeribacter pallidiroseus]|uniref:Ribonuclease Z n=1 Tax=Adhaeribacter pallidiroseus TaxID=2072847 RepID=A0A369QDE6_9BACT|nr:DUF1801 domain-containing protein [Adhaeribacter pallidiroseus]RDC62350.1 Ribonuclease Z [Adhaeribacter pallidiroseus]
MKETDRSKTAQNVDEYFQGFSEEVQAVLEQVRQTIRATAPQAKEVISYQIPGYNYLGPLVYFAGFKNHCSLFVTNKQIFKIFTEELLHFKTSGTTIHFTAHKPLPSSLIQKIVQFKMRENEERDALKKQTALMKKQKPLSYK